MRSRRPSRSAATCRPTTRRDRERAVGAGHDAIAIRIDDRQRLRGTRRDDARVRDRLALVVDDAPGERGAARERQRRVLDDVRALPDVPSIIAACAKPFARTTSGDHAGADAGELSRCRRRSSSPSTSASSRSSTSAPVTGAPPARSVTATSTVPPLRMRSVTGSGLSDQPQARGTGVAIARGRLDAVVAPDQALEHEAAVALGLDDDRWVRVDRDHRVRDRRIVLVDHLALEPQRALRIVVVDRRQRARARGRRRGSAGLTAVRRRRRLRERRGLRPRRRRPTSPRHACRRRSVRRRRRRSML